MFSLVITIISITLAATLALVTLQYIKDAVSKSNANTTASMVLTQGQQLIGAAELFKSDTGQWPANMNELLVERYLQSVPVAISTINSAEAGQRAWTMPLPGVPLFALQGAATLVCQSINKKSYGQDGILREASTRYGTQCYGSQDGEFLVVAGKAGSDLADVAADPAAQIRLGTVNSFAAPANVSSEAWLVPPSTAPAPAPAL